MPLEADIVSYLDANTTLTAGTTLFEGPCPENEGQAETVGVVHYASEQSDDYSMSASLTAPASELESFQVMTRNSVRATAITRANEIHGLLDNAQNIVINGRTYFHITSDGPPQHLSQDTNERWRRIASYRARKQRG